jgi:ferredoxin
MKYPIEKKYHYKVGTAVFNSSRCVSYTENKFCSECVRACPTHAIDIVGGWKPAGATHGADSPAPPGQVPERPIHVSFEKCIGCGACEYECNKIVMGEPAITVTSFGRAMPSKLD